MLSGADGRRITYWIPTDEGIQLFSPQWTPDMNDDGIAELLLTAKKPSGPSSSTVVYSLLYSDGGERRVKPVDMKEIFVVSNASVSGSALVNLLSNSKFKFKFE